MPSLLSVSSLFLTLSLDSMKPRYFYQPPYLGYRNSSDLTALFKLLIMYILAKLLIFRSFKEFSLVIEINIAPRHQLVLSHLFR